MPAIGSPKHSTSILQTLKMWQWYPPAIVSSSSSGFQQWCNRWKLSQILLGQFPVEIFWFVDSGELVQSHIVEHLLRLDQFSSIYLSYFTLELQQLFEIFPIEKVKNLASTTRVPLKYKKNGDQIRYLLDLNTFHQ